MIAYHVTTPKKFKRYAVHGCILPPVRAWKTLQAAEDFMRRTRRTIIIPIEADTSWTQLEGHKGQAIYTNDIVRVDT